MNVRAVAANVVSKVLKSEASLASLLPEAQVEVHEKDRALLKELCYGTLRLQPRLELYTKYLVTKPLRKKDFDILALLLLGFYQLRYTRIPDHAVLQETVAATTALKKTWAKALVNGVLRQFQQQQEEIVAYYADHPLHISCHPKWLGELFEQHWPGETAAIFDANNHPGPMTLRVNRRLLTRDMYLKKLIAADIDAICCSFSDDGIQLVKSCNVDQLPGFFEGEVSVQDESPQLAPSLLELAAGQRILDACAAPGGKTCHLLEVEPGLQKLVAIDLDAQRLKKITENLTRLQLEAELVCADACMVDTWWDGHAFDRILLDAPCSATGVIRRNPDIKFLRRPTDIAPLAELQYALLTNLWRVLKPDGILLYATCSILPEENDQVIKRFLAGAADAKLLSIDAAWGVTTSYGRQLLPKLNAHDGFYYARLRKESGG